MNPYITDKLATEHRHDLLVGARRHRLAALASCCKPSTWARWARSLRDALTSRSVDATCCAAA